MVHMGVALGILPPTGQPLPFVSFGGSALVTNLFAAGVLLNVSRFQRRPDEGPAGRGWNRRPRLSRAGTR
jgi:cell division protein FtsW